MKSHLGDLRYQKNYRYDKTGNEILERYFGRVAVEQLLKSIQGSILTVIESSFSDIEQRRAVKDLVKQEFSRRLDDVYEDAMAEPWSHAEENFDPETHQAYGTILEIYPETNIICND